MGIDLTDNEIKKLLLGQGESLDDVFACFETPGDDDLFNRAKAVQEEQFASNITKYALVNFSNFCNRSCFYCTLRAQNSSLQHYRMSVRQILDCFTIAYIAGYRNFIMQSGEDEHYSDDVLCEIIDAVKKSFFDSHVILCCGERPRKSYKALFDAGARGYILKVETSNAGVYKKLHDSNEVLENRIVCLYNLRELGYTLGSGFLVGLPGQTADHVVRDLFFVKSLQPKMLIVGPYISSKNTPIEDHKSTASILALRAIAIARLSTPGAYIPAVKELSYLASSHKKGAQEWILGKGANAKIIDFTPPALQEYFFGYQKNKDDIFG